MILVSLILLIVFDTYFAGYDFKNRWKEASLSVMIRDILSMLDETNQLYNTSISPQYLTNLISKLPMYNKTVWWGGTSGLIKTKIVVGCNCTDDELKELRSWMNPLKVNNRTISVVFVETSLDKINPYTDALIIVGYKDLTKYSTQINSYLYKGKGILEISDINSVDAETRKIFGIDLCSNVISSCGDNSVDSLTFITPPNASVYIYQPNKLFYHFPETFNSYTSEQFSGCSENVSVGNLTINGNLYKFAICNDTNGYRVYFDSNGDGTLNEEVKPRNSFNVGGFNFFLSYGIDNDTIAISYRPTYTFSNFIESNRLYPTDKDVYRILISKGNYTSNWQTTKYPIPAAVVGEKTAWMPNIFRNGRNVGDDERMLLQSLLLYVIDKSFKPGILITTGYQMPYVNVVDYDMYEVYDFYFGLGYPY